METFLPASVYYLIFPPYMPGLGTILSITVCMALLGALLFAGRLELSRWGLALWMVAASVPAAYTLTPSTGIWAPDSAARCSLGEWFWSGLPHLHASQVTANVALFVPLGLCSWLFRGRPRHWIAVFCSLAVPAILEANQMLVGPLHRECQVADVVGNQFGVLIGWLIGAMVVGAARIALQLWRTSARSADY